MCIRDSFQVISQPHFPTGPPQQGRFHEIMAEDVAAERFATRQFRQAAMIEKRLDADDGVMAPIITLAQLPVIQSGGEHPSVDCLLYTSRCV